MTRADLRDFELAIRANLDAFARDLKMFWVGALAIHAGVFIGGFYLAMHYARGA